MSNFFGSFSKCVNSPPRAPKTFFSLVYIHPQGFAGGEFYTGLMYTLAGPRGLIATHPPKSGDVLVSIPPPRFDASNSNLPVGPPYIDLGPNKFPTPAPPPSEFIPPHMYPRQNPKDQ